MTKILMIHYFGDSWTAARSEMRSLGALPAVRTGSTVLELCAEPQGTTGEHLGWLQDCIFCEFRHDPLFLVVLEPKVDKMETDPQDHSIDSSTTLDGCAAQFSTQSEQ